MMRKKQTIEFRIYFCVVDISYDIDECYISFELRLSLCPLDNNAMRWAGESLQSTSAAR